MKNRAWKIYFQDTLLGTVSLNSDGKLIIRPEDQRRAKTLTGLISHYRDNHPDASDAEFLAGIEQDLHGHYFAVQE